MSVTVPLHTPLTLGRAAALAQQSQGEGWGARRIRLQSPRGERPHLPARARRARCLGGRDAQQQYRHARGFRREGEPAARRQVERARLAPRLDQHGAQRGTARRFSPGPKHPFAIARPDQEQARRIEPELVQPRRMESPGLGIDEILPRPENGAFIGLPLALPRPQCESERETGRSGEIGDLGGVDLVQRGPYEPAVQDLVQSRHAETDPAGRGQTAPQSGLSKAAAQIGQGRCGLWHGSTIIVLSLFFYRTLPAGRRVESSSRPHASARG